MSNTVVTSIDYIKCIERNIERCGDDIKYSVRSESFSLINNLSSMNRIDNNDKLILKWFRQTKNFINEHPNIFFTKSDKGNTTVALNKEVYTNKLNEMFTDASTYEVIKKDPSNRLTSSLHFLLSRWKKKNYIDSHTYNSLNVTE